MSQNRIDGIMPTLSGNFTPKRLIFFDTETHIIEKENEEIEFPFRLGAGIFIEYSNKKKVKNRDVLEFYDLETFYEWILSKTKKRETLYIFAHNIGFDLRVTKLITYLLDNNYSSEPPIINDLVFIWKVKVNDCTLIFLDTANYGVISVEELGIDMGYPKIEIDLQTEDENELMAYCLRDVEILEKFMRNYIDFIIEHELGRFSVTLASQAMVAFRTSFYNRDITIHNQNGSLKLERDSYFGGRTEIFKYGYLGESVYYMVDVNSMYPYSMTQYPIPTRLVYYNENIELEDIPSRLKNLYWIIDADIETYENFIPIRTSKDENNIRYLHNPYNLEYPQNINNNIIFPIGRFRAIIHNQEIRELLRKGKIHRIHRISVYETTLPFNSYVEFFFNLKARYKIENNLSWRYISKLFLNSLYGKFGQMLPNREHIGYDTEFRFARRPYFNIDEQVFADELVWNWKVYNEFKKGETTFSSPAIAGAITANARMYLYKLFKKAGKENVFYCDTDSMIINQAGYDNIQSLLSKQEIGLLDTQKIGRRLIIRGNKDYRLDDKKTHKGVNRKAKKVGSNSWRYLYFEGFVTAWKNELVDTMRGQYRYKGRRTDYNKGIIQENNSISPFTLKEF